MHNNLLEQYLYVYRKKQNLTVLAFFDITIKYRRTALGPLWQVITLLLSVILLSIVWSTLFKMDIKDYVPRLFFGMTTYSILVAAITGGCTLISATYSAQIRTSNIPLQFYLVRHLISTIMNYLHYVPVFLILIIFADIKVNLNTLLLIPAFILVFLNFLWIATVMSIIGSRFRDIIPLTETLMSVGSLLTPILWDKKMLGPNEIFVYINPLTFFVEAVKYPWVGQNPGLIPYLGLIVMLIIGNFIQFWMIKNKGHRVPFWAS